MQCNPRWLNVNVGARATYPLRLLYPTDTIEYLHISIHTPRYSPLVRAPPSLHALSDSRPLRSSLALYLARIVQSVLTGKEKDILKDVPADRIDEAKEVFADIKKGQWWWWWWLRRGKRRWRQRKSMLVGGA